MDWDQVRTKLFSNVDDPGNTAWWDTAWAALHDPKLGSVIQPDTPPVEVALWLVTLRNIHSVYESRYWDYEYDPLFLDWWSETGQSWEGLVAHLRSAKLLPSGSEPLSEESDEATDLVRGALHTYCFRRHETVSDLLSRYVEEDDLVMFFLDGMIPRDQDVYYRISSFVENGLSF